MLTDYEPAALSRREWLKLANFGVLGMMQTSGNTARDAKSAVDHLILGAANRESAIAWLEERCGIKAMIGGSHPGRGTCNALVSFGGRQYMEILAPDPAQSSLVPQYEFLRKLPSPRLISWAVSTSDMSATVAQLKLNGVATQGPSAGSRKRPDGKMMAWQSLGITTDLGLIIPFFIQWDPGVIHPATDSPQGCRLVTLELSHPNANQVTDTLLKMGITARVRTSTEAGIKATLNCPKGKIDLA